jgi:2-polyprenyl-6-methoxyphenol hydroxylase-like FAD-dependent oxidoreductase
MDTRTDVVVVGAGPTGLAAGCEALRHGLSVRLVERREARAALSKALVVHARTLEVLEVMGCAEAVVAAGQRFAALHVRPTSAARPVRIDLLERAWGDTKYPFWLSVPQYEVERVLEARFLALGGRIEWATRLTSLTQTSDGVTVTLEGAEGRQAHAARWVLACDGGRSDTREQAGVSLEREGLGVTFALADVSFAGALTPGEGHAVLTPAGVLLVVPMPGPGAWRLIAQVPGSFDPSNLDAWRALVMERFGADLGLGQLGWTSKFDLTGGVAARFRAGNVFILGDAAHVHSPVGGQGLNTGIQDAHNLGWKLGLSARAGLEPAVRERLLDSYEAERRPIARQMVRTTTLATRVLTTTNPLARVVRGVVARGLVRTRAFQERLARGVGMLDLLSDGSPRLPNPLLESGGRLHDRVDPLRPTRLSFRGQSMLVRPDRLVAREGLVPAELAVPVEAR